MPSLGPHCFIVPIRDENGNLYPGVTAIDMMYKEGEFSGDPPLGFFVHVVCSLALTTTKEDLTAFISRKPCWWIHLSGEHALMLSPASQMLSDKEAVSTKDASTSLSLYLGQATAL